MWSELAFTNIKEVFRFFTTQYSNIDIEHTLLKELHSDDYARFAKDLSDN